MKPRTRYLRSGGVLAYAVLSDTRGLIGLYSTIDAATKRVEDQRKAMGDPTAPFAIEEWSVGETAADSKYFNVYKA